VEYTEEEIVEEGVVEDREEVEGTDREGNTGEESR
jgi:hypothetical protein